jgi:hypothetical protein
MASFLRRHIGSLVSQLINHPLDVFERWLATLNHYCRNRHASFRGVGGRTLPLDVGPEAT